MSDTPPKGQRFSQVYLRAPDLLKDSVRMRRRLGSLIGNQDHTDVIGKKLSDETGIPYSYDMRHSFYWPDLLQRIDLRDVLDGLTIVYNALSAPLHGPRSPESLGVKSKFLSEAQRIIDEEQVGYRIDELGGLHLAIDAAFEGTRTSAVLGLEAARYNGVRKLFEESFLALDRAAPDGKAAIRSIFFALESLFRLMFPNAPQLNGARISSFLKPRLNEIAGGLIPEIYASQKAIESLIDWVDAAHFYRHEPGAEEPAQPSLDFAILMVNQGVGFLRWLAAIDRRGT